MMRFINIALLIVEIVSFVITILFVIFGIYEQLMGPADAEKILKKLHVPLTYNQVLIIGIICITLMLSAHIFRVKLSGKM